MRNAFGRALRALRRAKGLTQEDFSAISSRTYLSTLERGKKSPTLDKAQALAQTVGVHLLSVLVLTFLYFEKESDIDLLLARVKMEILDLLSRGAS